MILFKFTTLLSWSLMAISMLFMESEGFSWGLERRGKGAAEIEDLRVASAHMSHAVPISIVDRYSRALSQLQELESKPLCHRIAARLLVNNCQLVNGQEEALARTDTDKTGRDFVDAYAISLAICDLERGSFSIPSSCAPFRESTLSMIPAPVKPQLHVSTLEITECLKDMALSDAAWNTWVNYRHQAMRFCQASLAENQKDYDIRLYQRLTKILERLTTQAEADVEARLQFLNKRFQETSESVETMGLQLDHFRSTLRSFDDTLTGRLSRSVQESTDVVERGLRNAETLSQMLASLMKSSIENAVDIATTHESLREVAIQKANDDIAGMLAALSAAALSSAALQGELASSHHQVAELVQKQAQVEVGLDRLSDLADALSTKFDTHDGRLDRAQAKAEEILGVLDNVAASTSFFRGSIFTGLGLSRFWPYIFCPAASLMVGSYGLQPSSMRNIFLVGFGEALGFLVSMANEYAGDIFSSTALEDGQPQPNLTLVVDNPGYDFNDIFEDRGLKRHIQERRH